MIRLASVTTLAAAIASGALAQDEPSKYNVLMILADDLGWSDTGIVGETKLYKTPHIDALAARGMVFTRAYAASPLCSPTRASILTGQNPARLGITAPRGHETEVILSPSIKPSGPPNRKSIDVESAAQLSTQLPTLGKVLQQRGLATGHFGKWHLGREPYSPLEQGFDVDVPHWPGPGPAGSFVAPWAFPDFKENYPQEHIEDRMAQEAVQWMGKVKDRQFYLQYWQFSVHAPFDAKAELIAEYRKSIDMSNPQRSPTYAAMVHSLDDSVGTLMRALEKEGLTEKTIIIFFSDNGGNMYNGIAETNGAGEEFVTTPTSNQPLRGGKATIFEGGIRVPAFIVWPGVVEPGSRSDVPIQSTDLYPTILSMLGIALPDDHVIDGVNLAPLLRGETLERRPLFTYFPHSPGVPDWLPPSVAVIEGDYKLIRIFFDGEDGRHRHLLFDLSKDIGETQDLSQKMPDKVEQLDAKITDFLNDTHAFLPIRNPKFNPKKYDPDKIGVQAGGLKLAGRDPRLRNGSERRSSVADQLQAKPKPAKSQRPLSTAESKPSAGGWTATRETVNLEVQGNNLQVLSSDIDPGIVADELPVATGPLTLKLEIKKDTGGPAQVYAPFGSASIPDSRYESEPAVPNEWTALEILLSGEGHLRMLRIDPMGAEGKADLRHIQLLDATGTVIKAWDFE